MPDAESTIRVSPEAHASLRELAAASGISVEEVVEEAVAALLRQRFWAEYDAAYARVAADPAAWHEFRREAGEWDATLADGLDGG